ncbi:MAG: nucleotidyltransferase family protein, partial [Gemmatimonas sp.]
MSSAIRTFREVPLDGGLFPSAPQMLLLKAALEQGPLAQQAFREWSGVVDLDAEFGWEALRLMPLVYNNLASFNTQHVLMGRLKGVYRRAWYQAHTLFRRTGTAVAALANGGVEVLLSKGAILAQEYYRNISLRPMSDVDICVHRVDVARAVHVLEREGWTSTSELTVDHLRFRHAMQFRHAEGGELDLHWRLLPEANDTTLNEMFWNDSEPVEFGGTRVQQLSPTSLLLQQVVHGMRWNSETPIRWIPDSLVIARVRGTDVNWNRLQSMARELRVTSRLVLGLSFLVEHFGFEVPANFLQAISRRRPALVERLENHVILRSDDALGTGVGAEFVRGLAEYTRVVDPVRHPIRVLYEYPHYLRLKWQLNSRFQILPFVARGVLRRLQFRLAPQ